MAMAVARLSLQAVHGPNKFSAEKISWTRQTLSPLAQSSAFSRFSISIRRLPNRSAKSTVRAEAPKLEMREVVTEDRVVGMELLTTEDGAVPDTIEVTRDDGVAATCIVYDYGFQADFLRETPTVPGSVITLAFQNFKREYRALRRNYLYEPLSDVSTDNVERSPVRLVLAYTGRALVQVLRFVDKVLTLYDALPEIKPADGPAKIKEPDELRSQLDKLTLSNKAVWAREHARPPIQAPWWINAPYYALCLSLDVIFDGRPIQRFWFLETVARMPYFSYISMLHLYESLGWWRIGAEVRKVHFAEEWNEMNHLKIMESLGGDRLWIDRFFAQHAAIFYYWVLNVMFLISPKVAYNFSELIEMHAVDTYGTFADENEELLKKLPPSPPALKYYYGEDLYLFDEFQTSRAPETRRPVINSLYDVFVAIRDDESEHVKTMAACQQLEQPVRSPRSTVKPAVQLPEEGH
eukprot:TRINITY_DN26776_c0_g1_i1.p1 TRINITY_DN26776_c0_g1~~TRINITY_DN26776_c0_g1_i1.p1  ORF type:complete len:465 (+),score=81.49 TRINITY_DN26776_c0_g1_i1:142-1536(+)